MSPWTWRPAAVSADFQATTLRPMPEAIGPSAADASRDPPRQVLRAAPCPAIAASRRPASRRAWYRCGGPRRTPGHRMLGPPSCRP